ncbi:MAG: PfkB family carbohydrate kinase [Pseudomonadota bacterium]
MGRPFDVVGFGAIAIDTLIRTDGGLGDGKGRVVERTEAHGGNVATALAAVASLGGRAAFIGELSDHPDSRRAAAALSEAGVDLSFAPRVEGARPVMSTILVDAHGDRFIAFDDEDFCQAAPPLDDNALSAAPILLVDAYAHTALAAVRRAKELGTRIVGDIEWGEGSATTTLIGLCDHLTLPSAFACARTSEPSPEEAAQRLWRDTMHSLVVTDGARGGVLLQRGARDVQRLPVFDVDAVDTTGAGDVFNGAFALATARGEDPLTAANFASAAAALSVTGTGGRGALPTEPACRALMNTASTPAGAMPSHQKGDRAS